MKDRKAKEMQSSRRRFLVGTGGILAGGSLIAQPGIAATETTPASTASETEPFFGPHQGGIVTPTQTQTFFAAFDLETEKLGDIAELFRRWTDVAAQLTSGALANESTADLASDSGEVLGLGPSRLTLTFGLGATVFERDGKDRYGLKNKRPEALVDMPRFNGEQLIGGETGGDLSIQACAENQQVAFHAVRRLAREANGIAKIRWAQTAFSADFGAKTPRNLMGFKDGTLNPPLASPQAMDRLLWVGDEGPRWMRSGSYVVARRIRISLEHWDRMDLDYQEGAIGRRKISGAPLSGNKEADPLDLAAADKDGNPVIPASAHVRLAAPAGNGGASILRRGYSYNNGVSFIAERWPPWRQGIEYDAGTFFVCYQRDPRTGFIKLFDKLSKLDAMNQFVTHVGSGLFACPPGVERGGYIAQALFESV
jgi:deferrochelatase/peroxidase EfeB